MKAQDQTVCRVSAQERGRSMQVLPNRFFPFVILVLCAVALEGPCNLLAALSQSTHAASLHPAWTAGQKQLYTLLFL